MQFIKANSWTVFAPVFVALALAPMPAFAQSDSGGFHGFQLDAHVGTMPSSTASGMSGLPAPGPSFTTYLDTTSRFVPSWYFGDGALLANQIAQAITVRPPPLIVPLDPVLTTASAQRQSGAAFGFRLGHAITRYVLGEITVDFGQGNMAITSSALSAVEATRASFQQYFNALLTRNPNAAGVATTSTATLVNNTGTQLLAGGDVNIAPISVSGFTPYFTIGGGLVLPRGPDPSITLVGNYAFTQHQPGTRFDGAPFSESDRVFVQYNVKAAVFLLLGGGVQHNLTGHIGVRGDVRVYRKATSMTVRVDTDPQKVFGNPPGRIARGPDPQLVFSTFPNIPGSLAQGVNHVDTFTGTGQQVSATVGFYLRF